MAKILVSHPGCNNDMEVTSADITVMVRSDNSQGSYRFCCPECQQNVVKPADTRTIELLASSGVRLETIHPSSELDEEVRRETRPPSDDEIIDFHKALTDANDVVGLLLDGEPGKALEVYREQRDSFEIDEHLIALRDLFDAYGIEGEDLFSEIRNRYIEGLGIPPEGDMRNDGPAGDIKNI